MHIIGERTEDPVPVPMVIVAKQTDQHRFIN